MKKIIFLIIILISSNTFAENRFGQLNDNVVEFYEKQIIKQLSDKKNSSSIYYKLYMEAAESLMAIGYYKYANKYFKKAITLNNAKLNAFTKVLVTYKLLDEKKNHQSWVKRAEIFIKENNTNKKSNSYKKYALEKSHFIKKLNGFSLNDAKYYFLNKKYKKSYSILKKIKLSNAPLSIKVFKDLNSYLVNDNKHKLLCADQYERYPASPSYSIKICKVLLNLKSKKKFYKQDITWIDKEIKQNYPEEIYLILGLNKLIRAWK
jgi:hypothetical protein